MTAPVSLSDASAMVLQARRTFGYTELPDWGWVHIFGPDAASFLQNRTSNDVLSLAIGQGQMNTVLDRSAKVQGVFSLHRLEETTFCLLAEREQIPHLIEHIEKFHIVEQFSVTDMSDEVSIHTLQGPESRVVLSAISPDSIVGLAQENDVCSIEFSSIDTRIVRRSLCGQDGYFIIAGRLSSTQVHNALNQAVSANGSGVILTPEALDTLRIEAGLPKMYADLDPDTLLPGTGLEPVAVSYSKGCYLGQETVARVKTYGALQRAMVGLLFAEGQPMPLPTPNAPMLSEGKEIGMMKSATFSPTLNRPVAMAFLGKEQRVPGRTLRFTVEGEPYTADVTLLPFYREANPQEQARHLMEQGLNQFADGQDVAAMALLEQAIALDGTLVAACESLGVILSRHDRIDEAMTMMERVLALDPDHVMAHTNLSIYWLKKGDKDKAEEEKAKATVAGMRKKAKEAGLSFDLDEDRRKKEAAARERVAMFEDALQHAPTDPLGNFGLGSALLELGEFARAIPAFQHVIAAQPKHSVAYLSLGKAYEGTGDTPVAIATYEKGIEAAAAKGDLMPLTEMQTRLKGLQ